MEESKRVPNVSAEAMDAFREHSQSIIEKVVAESLGRNDEVVQHGKEAEQLIASGIRFTTEMLEAAMAVNEVALLEDQLAWAMDRLPHDGVAPEHILSRLRIYQGVVRELLPEGYAEEIISFVEWMTARQQELMEQAKRA